MSQEKCNDKSRRLSDECDCQTDTFKCHDGNGCIALSQVCNSEPDCEHYSDECLCLPYAQCRHLKNSILSYGRIRPKSEICQNRGESHCSNRPHYLTTKLDKRCANSTVFSHHCIKVNYETVNYERYPCDDGTRFVIGGHSLFCVTFNTCLNGSDEKNCSNLFTCTTTNQPIYLSQVCDGIYDCSDKTDEFQFVSDGYLL